jgi:4-carboxymuconolactone decarboxylase
MTSIATPHSNVHSAVNQSRNEQGLAILNKIDGDAGQAVIDSLADIAPDLAHHIAAFAFGDIYARPGIEPRQRQLVTIGALTALGGCEPQLRVHIGAALNVGLSAEEIVEAIMHTTVYCGFPKALNAMFVAKDVFDERNLTPVGSTNPD